MKVHRLLAATIACALVLTACGDDDGPSTTDAPDSPGRAEAPPPGEASGVVVLRGAERVGGVIEELVAAFEDANPDAEVQVGFDDEAGLRDLVAAGTDSDANVALVADLWLDDIDLPDDASEARPFGRTLYVIVVPPGNPAGVTDTSVFAADDPARTIACGPSSELGNFAEIVLRNAGVSPEPGTVRASDDGTCEAEAVDLVARGELDAALVARIDVADRDDVEYVEIPDDVNLVFDISYVLLADSPATSAFAAFVDSDEGVAIRTATGYLP